MSLEPSPSPLAYQTIPTDPTGPELTGDPLTAEDTDGPFVLTVTASQHRYRAGQVVEIAAAVAYVGPEAEVIALGSSHALVGFALEGGEPPVQIFPASTSDCAPHSITPTRPLAYPFVKSGSTSPDDPDVAFREAYFSSPELRLPAGKWTIRATTGFYTGRDCGEGRLRSMQAEITLKILP